MPTNLVVIGGSDAGISAALRARELDRSVNVTVVVADAYPNYSICGLPFYLSGEVSDWRKLAHRTLVELESHKLKFLLNYTAQAIDPVKKAVVVRDKEGHTEILPYDQLVIGTGAKPLPPRIKGLDLPGVYFLHTMENSFEVEKFLTHSHPESALIIGAGYIGLEMADALTLRGLKVTLVGRAAAVLPTVDPELGQLVEAELSRHEVEVINGMEIEAIQTEGSKLVACGPRGFQRKADLVLVATGVRPATELAVSTGVKLGAGGAIAVSRKMATNLPHIYAAGDCVETWHRLLKQNLYLPLGTTAHKQGRIAGENAVGGQREFAGTLGTQVVKVFDLVIARSGLREEEARAAGFTPFTTEIKAWDHKVYYPGARELIIRLTGDQRTGQLLGAQMLGSYHSEIAKRIDIIATALFHAMKVEDLNELDLSYTPPLGSPWEVIQTGAQAWVKALQEFSLHQDEQVLAVL